MGGKKSDKSAAEAGLNQVGQNVQQAAAQTPEEKAQYQGSFSIGDLLNHLYQSQLGQGQAPAGFDPTQNYLQQGGDLAQGIYNQVLPTIQNPDATYLSTLQPALLQAQNFINADTNRRGLLNSGLNIEQMGRAGVDLAIQEANNRLAYRQQALQNASALSSDIYGRSQNSIAGLANLYNTQQSAGQASLGRQATGAANAGQYFAYPWQAQLGNYYGQQAAMGALPGQALGAIGTAAGAYFGGPMGAMAGNKLGTMAGNSISGYSGPSVGNNNFGLIGALGQRGIMGTGY